MSLFAHLGLLVILPIYMLIEVRLVLRSVRKQVESHLHQAECFDFTGIFVGFMTSPTEYP